MPQPPPVSPMPCPLPLLDQRSLPHPDRLARRGELVKVRHGIYANAQLWEELAPWNRYLARVHAVARSHPDAVFCLESAACLLGMGAFGDPGIVHVLVAPSAASRLVAGVRTHRSSLEREIVQAGGLLVTSRLDTAVDLARTRERASGLAFADAALRLDPRLSAAAMRAVNERRVTSRGRNRARWALDRATPVTESHLESISLAAIEWLGFPAPRLQVTLPSRTGERDRSDFVWESGCYSPGGVAGEADGDHKYDGRFGDARAALRNQGRRDERLREHVRTVAHWGWNDATTWVPLRGILLGAGLVRTSPEDTASLAAMTRSLTSTPPHRTTPPPSAREGTPRDRGVAR